MTILSDMQTELQARLLTANNSGLIPSTRITSALQDATKWAGGLFFWPSLNRSRLFTALKNIQSLNYDYYDYPPDFITDSILRLYIDGVKYNLKSFQDFIDYTDASLDNNVKPDPTNHYFANFGRQFFVYPSYSGTAPNNNSIVWGNVQHPAVINPGDTTIFSNWDEMGNEAIVRKAMAVLLKRIDPGVAAAEEQGATGILQLIWKNVVSQAQRQQRLNHPQFIVRDMFGTGVGQAPIGNFNIPADIVG